LPEGTETATLVGVCNGIALAEDFTQQLALAAFPGGNAFTYLPVQITEVLLHFTEISQQAAGAGTDFKKPLADAGFVHQFDLAGSDPADFGIQRSLALFQFGNPRVGVALAALHLLTQQVEDRQQSRLGTNKLTLAETGQPLDGFLDR